MVVIRLSRGGSKKKPFYQMVVADSRDARDGRHIERIGFYNPVAQGQAQRFKVDMTRWEHWLSQGAQPSDRVRKVVADFQRDAATAPAA